MKPNAFVLNLLQAIFTLVGLGLVAGGYFAAPGSRTADGFPLNYFLYGMGGFFVLFPLLLFGVIRYITRRSAERQAYLVANGIRGTARVLNMQQTNLYINGAPHMVMQLQIITSLGERFEASYKKALPLHYHNIIRPDVDLPVYVDPSDRKKLFVDFEGAWTDLARRDPGR